MDNEKKFCLEAYDFISGLLEHIDMISIELSSICLNNYSEAFKESRDAIKRLSDTIESFIDNSEEDYEGVWNTLKNIREYYAFYCVTLNNTFPSTYNKDAKYIIESISTSKLVLSNKLKKLKNKL